jgi:hypothetical protein
MSVVGTVNEGMGVSMLGIGDVGLLKTERPRDGYPTGHARRGECMSDKLVVVTIGIYDPNTDTTEKQLRTTMAMNAIIDLLAFHCESLDEVVSNLLSHEFREYLAPLVTEEVLQNRRAEIKALEAKSTEDPAI